MNLFEAKHQIVEIGKRMWTREWVAANDGNISCRIGENEFVCTPSGVSKGFMDVSDMIVVDSEGRKLGGGTLNPSSEIKMHLYVYRERPDVQAVCHAHPPTSTGFAVSGISLDQCVLPEVVALIGQIPCAAYGLPSTDEIPQSIAPFVKENSAVLLANHGALTWGDNLMQAYYRMETLEHFSKILLTAVQLGKVNLFSKEQATALESLREKFNLNNPFTSCNSQNPQIPSDTGYVRDIHSS